MSTDTRALPPGTVLLDYTIERVLGFGGFGITYLAACARTSCKLASSGTCSNNPCKVAIKEYFPREFAYRGQGETVQPSGGDDAQETFAWGLERFREEATTLAQLDYANVVEIKRFFSANGTAYLVMPFYEGQTLKQIVDSSGPLPPDRFEAVFRKLLHALEQVHGHKLMHRDIKPANIFITSEGEPILIDFGAARTAIGEHSKSITSLLTPGYGAYEQHSTQGSQQGPWTDIYGLAATMYFAATRTRPADSFDRDLNDTLIPLRQAAGPEFARQGSLLALIEAGLAVRPMQRPRSVRDWIGGSTPLPRPSPTPATNSNNTKTVAIVVGTAFFGLILLAIVGSQVPTHNTVASDAAANNTASAVPVVTADAPTTSVAPTASAPPTEQASASGTDVTADAASPAADPDDSNIIDAVNMAMSAVKRADAPIARASQNPDCGPSSNPWDNCYGTFRFTDGTVYKGEWHHDHPSGSGLKILTNGRTVVGDFTEDPSITYGAILYPNKSVYLGQLNNTVAQGLGIIKNPSGTVIYHGHFSNGKPDN